MIIVQIMCKIVYRITHENAAIPFVYKLRSRESEAFLNGNNDASMVFML